MEINDNLIAQVGLRARQLIQDFGEEFGLSKCIVGVCFSLQDTDKYLFFAEAIVNHQAHPDLKGTKNTQYILPIDDPYVELIIKIGRPGVIIKNIDSSDPKLVLNPLKTLFSTAKTVPDKLKIFRIFLGNSQKQNESVFYVVYDGDDTNCDNFLKQIKQLNSFSYLLANLVRQTIFFAIASADYAEAEQLRNMLEKTLSEKLVQFTETQKIFLDGNLHPAVSLLIGAREREEKPAIIGTPDDKTKTICEAITMASKIKWIRSLEGSFRSGEKVFLAEVIPRNSDASHSENVKGYQAVIKSCSRQTALKEQRGLNRLWGYHEIIGNYLPQTPLHFPFVSQSSGKTVKFATMTPRISGNPETFSYFTETNWENKNRLKLFSRIFAEAKNFLDGITDDKNNNTTPSLPHNILYEDHFNTSKNNPKYFDAARRSQKLRAIGWPTLLRTDVNDQFLDLYIKLESFKQDSIRIINPYHLHLKCSNDQPEKTLKDTSIWRFADSPKSGELITFVHGDFHSGNVLVSHNEVEDEPKIVILDFDYVQGGMSKYYDRATLEASFLLSIASSDSVSTEEKWIDRMLPTLLVLTNHKLYLKHYENNRFAHDVFFCINELYEHEERDPDPFLQACRATALYRLIASIYKKAKQTHNTDDLKKNNKVLWTATIFLGLVLQELVSPKIAQNRENNSYSPSILLKNPWI